MGDLLDEYGVSFLDALNTRRLDPDAALEHYFRAFATGGHVTNKTGTRDLYALASGGAVGNWMDKIEQPQEIAA